MQLKRLFICRNVVKICNIVGDISGIKLLKLERR